ncbi:MAG TPA: hypothetical protein VF587_05375 [Solirubrobacteraceae bacterium]|jgi:hypothetical protein
MRSVALSLVAVLCLAAGALAAVRVAERTAPAPGLSTESAAPLFTLTNLRHGDRAERCVSVTNEGGEARGFVVGRVQAGDLARHLGVVVRRGCGDGPIVFSGGLDDLVTVRDEGWAAGARRRYGIAVEVVGSDAEVQGRRAVQEFGFGIEAVAAAGEESRGGGEQGGSAEERGAQGSGGCTQLRFVADGRRRPRPVLIKRQRVDARVTAKLILRIYGAAGQQRLVLVTGLRVGRRVLPGRRFGKVAYGVGGGATVTSRKRPFRVRIAPGALKPGRNVVRVTVVPKGGRPVKARYVLKIAAPKGSTECEIG